MRRLLALLSIAALGLSLAACAGGSGSSGGGGRLSGNSPDGVYKVGRPYTVAGQRFVPREDWNYNEVGIASWYGPNFHGRPTANGERFDMNLYTAAHTTLQLPVHARVTNLENGRSVIVRINDRGPFVSDRIIDLSRAAAQELDMIRAGTARVRVEVLERAPLNVQSADARRVMEGDTRPRRFARNARDRDTDRRGRPENGGTATVPPTPVAIDPPVVTASAYPETPVALEAPYDPPQQFGDVPDRRASYDPTAPTLGPQMYVQTGSYLLEANALDVAETLEAGQFGSLTSVEPARVNGRLYYRVRLGPFASPEEASAVARQVASYGHEGARIVTE